MGKSKSEIKKKQKFLNLIVLLFSLFFTGGVVALIVSGGNFSIIQFFSGIAGGDASGGVFDARFHSTAFQPVGKAEGGVFTATIGPLSSIISEISGIYDFYLSDPTDQTISNSSSAVYTITLTNNGTLIDNYTISVNNINNANSVLLNTSSINALALGSSVQFTLSVGPSAIGNYTTNVAVVSQGNSSITRTISIVTQVTSLPIISSYSISPYAVVNSSDVLVYISALSAENAYAQITKPDSSTQIINLTNNANTTFSNTSLTGRYNVTLYANNSQGIVNVSDYFESFKPKQFNFNVVNFNTTGVNSSWEIQYRDQVIRSNSSDLGNHSLILADAVVNVKIKSHSDRLQITLRDINLSSENGKPFGMDKLTTPVSGYLLTYGINNSYNFTNATLQVYYDDTSFSNEGNLKFDKCDNWNFPSQKCNGSFNDITSSATQNTAENYFEYVTTSFSGFGIREVSSSSGDTGGGSSGGGGGSSCTYNQNYDWGCSTWGVCINGQQARTCKGKNNCGNTYGRPVTARSCIVETPELSPEQLLNITWNLDDSIIESISELVGVITFESFGIVPTPVDLTFIILDKNGREVYRAKGNITVTTEEVMRWRFIEKGLNELPQGKYNAILETLYNVDVHYEFRQDFEVRKAEYKTINKFIDWVQGVGKWYLIVILIVLFLIIGFVLWFIIRKK